MLKCSDLSKSYDGQVRAVDSLNLAVNAGEIHALLGPNGSGKTTTVKMILGLLQPDTGAVSVGGYDISSQAMSAKRLIGYKPEAPFLYDHLTGTEFLHFIAQVKHLSDLTQITHLLESFELREKKDVLIKTYSLGMKSKLAVCGALLGPPKLIILDEPTNALDPTSIYVLKDWLARLAENGSAILITSHILDFVEKLCTAYTIILRGRVVTSSTRGQLQQSSQSLESLYISTLEGNPSPRTI